MKKLFSFLGLAIMFAFASCMKEEVDLGDGSEKVVRFSVNLPQQEALSRTAFSDPVLKDHQMRLFLYVMYGEKDQEKIVEVKTLNHTFTAENSAAIFDIRLVTDKTYKVAVWADFGEDYYKVTGDVDGTPKVEMASQTIAGSNNLYDAYFAIQDVTFTKANETVNMTLSRPFGLVKINTLDYKEGAVVNAGLLPTHYTTTISVPVEMSLLDGTVGDPKEVTITSEDANIADVKNSGELSFDYFFAEEEQANLESFTMKYSNADNDEIVSYEFTNIPVRRNYKTNISGNILTKQGTISVTIDQLWAGELPQNYTEVNSMVDLQEAIDNAKDGDVIVLTAGEYTGNIVLANTQAKSFTIQGVNAGINQATLTSTPAEETVFTGQLFSDRLSTDQLKDLKIVVDGITFKGDGYKIANNQYNAISDLTIQNCKFIPSTSENNSFFIATNHNASDNCRSTIRLYNNKIGDKNVSFNSYYLVRLWAVKHVEVVGNLFEVQENFAGLQHINISNLSGAEDASIVVKNNTFVNGKAGVTISSWKVGDGTWSDNFYKGTIEVSGNTFINVAPNSISNPLRNNVPVFVSPEFKNDNVADGREVDHGQFDADIIIKDNEYQGYTPRENVIVNLRTFIRSVEDLKKFAQDVNNGKTYKGETVVLDEDLDLGSENWEPIGKVAGNNKFMGTFDGNGKTIRNLKISDRGEEETVGLFGVLNGTVKDLRIEGVNITHITDGRIAGGIGVVAGSIFNTGLIENVVVRDVNINGNRWSGGIVGYLYGSVKNCRVENITLTLTPDNVTGNYDNGDKAGGIVGYSASDNKGEISGNSAKNVTIKGYRDLGGIAGAANTIALTNNTVENITIEVDQKTGYYGMEDPNAEFVLGRSLDGKTLDVTNTSTGENKVSYVYFVENGTYLNKLNKILSSNSTFYVEAGEYASFGLYTQGKENVSLIADGEVIVNGRLTFGTHSNYTRSIPESTLIEGFTVKGELFLNACGKYVVKNNKAAQITMKTFGLTDDPSYTSDIEFIGNTVDGTLATTPQSYGIFLVPNVTGYKLNVTGNTIRNVGSHAFVIQGSGDGSAKTTPGAYSITENNFESWGLANGDNRGAVKVWADTSIAPESMEGGSVSDLSEAAKAFVNSVLSGNNVFPDPLRENCVIFEFYGLPFNSLE